MSPRTLSVLLGVGLAALGCRKPPPPQTFDAGPPPSDHLAPGELAEGVEKAYALPLPRVAKVASRSQGSVFVVSTAPPEQLSNFVRARVKAGRSLVGTTATTFESVVVPSEPNRTLTIEIRTGDGSSSRSTMTVRDVTLGPPATIPTEEAWKRAGMTPDGKLLDPKHLQ